MRTQNFVRTQVVEENPSVVVQSVSLVYALIFPIRSSLNVVPRKMRDKQLRSCALISPIKNKVSFKYFDLAPS